MGDFVKAAAVGTAAYFTGGAALAGAGGAAATGATVTGTTMVGGAALTTVGSAVGGASMAAPTFLGLSSAAWAGIGTGMTALTSIRAGQATQVQMDIAADQEKQAAISREVARKRRLVSSLATQNAMRGAQGVQLTGSPASMMLSDIAAAEYDTTIAAGTTASRISSLQTEGKYAMQAGVASAGSSLLDFGTRMAERG
jgi:hypothetical protein